MCKILVLLPTAMNLGPILHLETSGALHSPAMSGQRLSFHYSFFRMALSKAVFPRDFSLIFFPCALEMSPLSFVAQIPCVACLEPLIPSKDINIFIKFSKSSRHHKLGYIIERLPIL